MADDSLSTLTRTENNTVISLEQSKKFNEAKTQINGICRGLSTETQSYNPQDTIKDIDSYIISPYKLERILYSEISDYVFSLGMSERGVFSTNLEKLLLHSLDDENSIKDDTRKIVVKIYDHFQLAQHQIENVNNIFANSIDDAKENLQKQVKSIEKEYISILGIFASIVFAFVGGITFSTSVLQNISSVSVFRLLLVVDLLAFVLINVIYILVRFIFAINDKEAKVFSIISLNLACVLIAFFIIAGWILSVNHLPTFISQFLPWI